MAGATFHVVLTTENYDFMPFVFCCTRCSMYILFLAEHGGCIMYST